MTEPPTCPMTNCGLPAAERGAVYRTDRPGEVFEEDERRHVHPTRAQRRYQCASGHSWFVDAAYPCPAEGCDHVAGAIPA